MANTASSGHIDHMHFVSDAVIPQHLWPGEMAMAFNIIWQHYWHIISDEPTQRQRDFLGMMSTGDECRLQPLTLSANRRLWLYDFL